MRLLVCFCGNSALGAKLAVPHLDTRIGSPACDAKGAGAEDTRSNG